MYRSVQTWLPDSEYSLCCTRYSILWFPSVVSDTVFCGFPLLSQILEYSVVSLCCLRYLILWFPSVVSDTVFCGFPLLYQILEYSVVSLCCLRYLILWFPSSHGMSVLLFIRFEMLRKLELLVPS